MLIRYPTALFVSALMLGELIANVPAALAQSPDLSSDLSPPKATARASWYEQHQDGFLDLYRWLHSHPEVSFQEQQTAAKLAGIWREHGFVVTTGVGGHG